MALSCIPKSVISGASCVENPAGLGNYLFAVPLENIASIAANDEKNQYDITPKVKEGGSAPAKAALKGYRIDYKSQTGQYSSDDNGTGKGKIGDKEIQVVRERKSFASGKTLFRVKLIENGVETLKGSQLMKLWK